MKTNGHCIILEDAQSFSPNANGVDYTDQSGARIHIPIKTLIRLYEAVKHDAVRNNADWDQFCDLLFSA